MEKKCIGIDVGGTTVKIGIFETDGTLVYKWEVPSRKEENGAYILPDVAASIRKKLNERGIPMDAVIGAGMGFPGPVQPDGYVEVCVNLGWRDLNPQKILSELLDGMPVRSGNDANVAALGEMWQGTRSEDRCRTPRTGRRDRSYPYPRGRERNLQLRRTRLSGTGSVRDRYRQGGETEDGGKAGCIGDACLR